MVVDPRLWPWTEMEPTLVDVTLVNVRLVPPTTVPLFEMVAMAGPLLVTVTVMGLGGVAPRLMPAEPCILTPVVTLPMLMLGAVTVAVICWYCDGVLNPAG